MVKIINYMKKYMELIMKYNKHFFVVMEEILTL